MGNGNEVCIMDRKEREQLKLRMFFDPDRWERLLNQAHEKELNRTLIQYFMTPKGRAELYDRIVNHNYAIQVPHKTKIPKDTGGFRIVYANEDEDRIYKNYFNGVPSISLFDEENDPHTKYIGIRFNSNPDPIQISSMYINCIKGDKYE